MKAYLVYSIHPDETYLIPLLSSSLNDRGLSTFSKDFAVSQDDEGSQILDSHIFIGIISNRSNLNEVVKEFRFATENNIPGLLFIEDTFQNIADLDNNTIFFSRTNPGKAFETLFTLKNLSTSTDNFRGNVSLLLAGVILEILSETFTSSNKRNFLPALTGISVVEQRLLQLNDARFQELCDVFLGYRYPEIKLFLRKGSQSGVQKTVKGTPDTLIQLQNGYYIMVEITSQEKGLVKKILLDIEKVGDEEKTKVPVSKIWKLIVCTNRKLSQNDLAEIETAAKKIEIQNSEYFDLGRLAIEIYLHHQNLAKDYLELSVDSGQIVSLNDFVNQYNTAGHSIATGLSNPFLHRTDELNNLLSAIESHKLILISGPPGVGKTKLALEGIRVFTDKNPEFRNYSIHNKDVDILEDLYSTFKKGSKSILFIDDVNRFNRINSIIGFFQHSQGVQLKIVLTTRDYGLSHVQGILSGIDYSHLRVEKLKDEELLDIIKGDPFNITNSEYHPKILDISDGNARLAIMTAKLALDNQNIQVLHDVSDLLDKYFETFTKDEKIFNDKTLLKTIGILSFFYTLPYTNHSVLDDIASTFDVPKTDLINSINTLEELEFLDINFSHVKIADQTLSTYYFFKVFIQKKFLSLFDLLKNYFPNNETRFTDSFYPVVNSFGFEKIKDLTQSDLKKYYHQIQKENPDTAFNFIKVFSFYLQEETLELVYRRIESLPETDRPYESDYSESRTNYSSDDRYLELLKFFYQSNIYLKETLELSFSYVKKKPETHKELLKNIVQELTFDVEDRHYGYIRQKTLFHLFQSNSEKKDLLYIKSFLAVAHEFLEFGFRHAKSARGGKISLYTFRFPLTPESKEIRLAIWNLLESLFPDHEESVLSVLQKHASRKPDVEKNVMAFDLEFLVEFINNNLSSTNFKHCFYVQELLHWIKRLGIELKESIALKDKFKNKTYTWYEKINWNMLKGKEEHDYKNWDDFQKLKERDIRNFTFFKTDQELAKFVEFFNELKALSKHESYHLNNSLDIILEECIKKKPEFGFTCFQYMIENLIVKDASLGKTIRGIAQHPELREMFWHLYINHGVSDHMTMTFLSCLPSADVTQKYVDGLYNLLEHTSQSMYIYPDHYNNFKTADPRFFEAIGEISLDKNSTGKSVITIDERYFEITSADVSNLDLLKRMYLQQEKLQNHFDHSGNGLFHLVTKDPEFLIDYLKYIASDDINHSHYSDKKVFGKIWSLPNSRELMDKVFEVLMSEGFYSSSEHFANAFFKHADSDKQEQKKEYILNFIRRFSTLPKRMDVIFDVVHHSHRELFKEAFHLYLNNNPRVEDFAKINWTAKQLIYSGDTIIGDYKAAQWRTLLDDVEEANLGIAGIFIVKFIKDQIESEKRNADWERERKFLSRR